MSSKAFSVVPAGTPVKASHNGTVSYFERQKILPESLVNTTNGTWVGGAELHFRITSSHSRWWAPNLSKIMVTMSVTYPTHTTSPPSHAVRFVTCPVSQLFSSCRCSINGVSVESKASHYGLLS